MIRALILLALILWPSLAMAAADAPCRTRYEPSTVFPGENVEAARADLAATKGWGIAEHLRLETAQNSPSPLVLAVAIPKGSINPKNPRAPQGGVGFRWRPEVPRSVTAACLSYGLFLPANFDFNKGGKLPGLFGGSGPAGGKKADGLGGFSVRLMWRSGGAGEVYAYIPGHPNGRGLSIGRGTWHFPRGRWIDVEEEVVLNDPGTANGHLKVWIDGELKISLDDVTYRTANSLGIAGVMADIFYGGKTVEWAAPQDTVVRITPFRLSWR